MSRSSAEAEYRAMAITYSEMKWIKDILASLGITQNAPMPLYYDNQAALRIAANPVFHEHTKHIEVDCHFIRDTVTDGIITTSHVRTTEQLVDLLTKPLGRQHFKYLLDKMAFETFMLHLEGVVLEINSYIR